MINQVGSKKLKKTPLLLAVFLAAILFLQSIAHAEVIYYHTDALGTPVVATNEQGQVIWRESYTPHGTKLLNQAAAQSESRGFTGHVHDKITGLTYMGARSYDPELGRFMGIDPKGFRESDPHSFNPYVYANNNPYKYVDPDGKVAETVLDIVSLGLSIAEYNANPTLWNGIGLTYDIVATAVPFIPAGFGIIKSGSRAADALRGADGGTDAAKHLPNDTVVVRGGTSELPPPGKVFSGAAGNTLEDAAAGVPHGQIRATTAGQIRATGGSVVRKPERTRSGTVNEKHVDVCLGSGPCPFGSLQPNPVPKSDRVK